MTPVQDHEAFLLTPPGTGAIALIRVTGARAVQVVMRIFHPSDQTALTDSIGHRLIYGRVVDGDEVIDDVFVSLASRSRGVHGNDAKAAVDISCHGGLRVVERILHALESLGVTVLPDADWKASVWPTHNEIEREVIGAALSSRTERAIRFAARMRANLVLRLDEVAKSFQANPDFAREELESLIGGHSAAKILLNGAIVALIGPPNSGKSTLFNRLVGRPSAVTSPTPGTTRDWIAEDIDIEGVPITLVDTAGRHANAGVLERVAVDRGITRAQSANVVLLVLDCSRELAELEKNLLRERSSSVPRISVATKSDLGSCWDQADSVGLQPSMLSEFVQISALTGSGCDVLAGAILKTLGFSAFNDATASFFTDRQVILARKALYSPDPVSARTIIGRELIGR